MHTKISSEPHMNAHCCGNSPVRDGSFQARMQARMKFSCEEHEKAHGSKLSGPISRDTSILSLRYPILRDTVFSTPPKRCDTPPWHLVSHRHISAIPHFATYRAIVVRYSIKTSTKQFCDTIATSTARYEKYHCLASMGPS